MGNEQTKLSPIELVEKEIKEKTTNLQGLTSKVQEAKTFIQQNEPNIFALNGAIQELNLLKIQLAKK